MVGVIYHWDHSREKVYLDAGAIKSDFQWRQDHGVGSKAFSLVCERLMFMMQRSVGMSTFR